MAEAKTCSQCGAELLPDVPGGHCVRCLLELALTAAPEPTGPAETEILSDPSAGAAPSSEALGRFTRYRLLEKLGEGGCGIVYRAQQLEPVRREVALKVIKLGMDTRNVIARFDAERQALALMNHPNIAQVLDAGGTDTGRPFFVMELIHGQRITEYCRCHNLATGERLKLFTQVCHAVQHAHQKGIIHRDLKPSNVLVTEHDGVPVPKVIDFGVAKATGQQRLTDQTVFTAFEQFIGTPAYMSPEQAGFGGHDIDTRTDIYALGVLLYELLAGRPPFDPERLRRAPIDEVFRLIREEEPPRPSAQLAAEAAAQSGAEANIPGRTQQLKETLALLRGDLDWIVMKALEKDRARRYETANAMAADLARFLNEEPVVARPPGAWYRLRKLTRRNRTAFLSGATIFVLLLAGLGVSLFLYSRESQARRISQAAERKAEVEAAKSRQVANFLENMLQSVKPSVALGRDTRLLHELLIRTTAQVSIGLTNQPDVQGEICWVLGQTYLQLGDYTNALALERVSLRLRQSALGDDSLPVAQSLEATGDALCQLHRWRQAEPVLREALLIQQHKLESTNDTFVATLRLLAMSVSGQGRLQEAESLERRALALARRLPGDKGERVAVQLDALATIEMRRHHLAEAEELIRQSLRIFRGLYPQWSLNLVQPLTDLGNILKERGDAQGAKAAWSQAQAIRTRWLGKSHRIATSPHAHLPRQVQSALASELDVVQEIHDDLLQIADGEMSAGARDIVWAKSLALSGMLEYQLGHRQEAQQYFKRALSLARRLPPASRQQIKVLEAIAGFVQGQDDYAQAARFFGKAVEVRRNDPNNGPADLANNILQVAFDEVEQTNYAKADRLIQQAWSLLEKEHQVPPGYETLAVGNAVRALAHMSLLVTNKALSAEWSSKAAILIRRLPVRNEANLDGMNGRNLFMTNMLKRLETQSAPHRHSTPKHPR